MAERLRLFVPAVDLAPGASARYVVSIEQGHGRLVRRQALPRRAVGYDSPPPGSEPLHVQRAEGAVILTMVVFLGMVVITCIVGVVVIPRFDRRPALSPAASAADRRNATASRDV